MMLPIKAGGRSLKLSLGFLFWLPWFSNGLHLSRSHAVFSLPLSSYWAFALLLLASFSWFLRVESLPGMVNRLILAFRQAGSSLQVSSLSPGIPSTLGGYASWQGFPLLSICPGFSFFSCHPSLSATTFLSRPRRGISQPSSARNIVCIPRPCIGGWAVNRDWTNTFDYDWKTNISQEYSMALDTTRLAWCLIACCPPFVNSRLYGLGNQCFTISRPPRGASEVGCHRIWRSGVSEWATLAHA